MRPSESEPTPSVRPPRLNGRYLVARLIGRGAQARVYLAFDLRLKQWRAVKVLALSALEDDHVRARFEQEAQAMARLTHPNLLRVVDVDHDGVTPYMVMELARGGAITEWMKRNGPVPAQLACRITQACAHGLGHAHALGVVHRDVKPHNILIRDDGSVALTDFGIAQVAEGITLTATGTIMGTFAFMAPEQRTDAKGVDHRADVYSLGASLFTMLTGKTSAELFFAESRDGILRGVPEALRPIILTACRYEREQRYPTMAALADDVETRLAKLPADPEVQGLTGQLLPVPGGLPEWIPTDPGIEELIRSLAIQAVEEAPTMVSAQVAAPDLTPAPLPYKMPAVAATRRMGERRGEPTPAGQVPSYVERAPEPEKPAPRTSGRDRRRFEIDDRGARSLHDKTPQAAAVWSATQAAVVLTAVALIALLGALTAGVGAKLYASWRFAGAGEVLVQTVSEERQVITDLVDAGAHEGPLLERWTAFEEARGDDVRADAAAAFVAEVERASEAVDVEGLAMSHVSQMTRALRAFEEARESRETARTSLVGQLSGPLGLF